MDGAMHRDVQVSRSTWMCRSGVPESGRLAILSNWEFLSDPTNPPSNKKAPLCGAFLLDGAPGEIRTPDRSVRSPTGKMVSFYKSTTCDLDQSQNVVTSSVNEPYLVLCWYIIATYHCTSTSQSYHCVSL
jgi:hypothetical protein